DLDAELAFQRSKSQMHEWEYSQAVRTGVVPLSENRVKPRYINEVPKALERAFLPSGLNLPPGLSPGFFQGEAKRFLREVGGTEADKQTWWPHVAGIVTYWLRWISSNVEKWNLIDQYLRKDGDKLVDIDIDTDDIWVQWEYMGLRLATLVINRALDIEAEEESFKAKIEDWSRREWERPPTDLREARIKSLARRSVNEVTAVWGRDVEKGTLSGLLKELGIEEKGGQS
ncbi:MAG: hypothetical protein Q7R34_04615, partial [Dehalococcoidia bacterium]|nr:hypothetical protein [Dehalococcoidia bacterium]